MQAPVTTYPNHRSRKPLVTILLASRNGERFLSEQLRSFAAQTYSNWELVVSDDGSTDGTLGLVERFAQGVEQRVVVREGPRLGFWQNFVSLVRSTSASGTLFAYSDQDDIWLPEKLENAVTWFETLSRDEPALYFTRTELMTESGNSAGLSRYFTRKPSFRNALLQNIGGGNTMVFNSKAREALLLTSADAELVAHDWWTYQVVTGVGGRAYYDSRPSLRYRQHGQNTFGANTDLKSRWSRFSGLANGVLVGWNSRNIRTLSSMASQLTEENRRILSHFVAARNSKPPKGVFHLFLTGAYRQNVAETVAIYLAALLGRI